MNRRGFLQQMAMLSSTAIIGASEVYAQEKQVEVTRYSVTRWNGERPSRLVRVAFMSDFHQDHGGSTALLQEAVNECQAARPDAILLGGDFVNDDWRGVEDCANALRTLSAPLGTFYVLGNHDNQSNPARIREVLKQVGLVDVTNRSVKLSDGVVLCGLDDLGTGKPNPDVLNTGPVATRLVLSHDPLIFPHVRFSGCVAICGHTHGGQIDIPLIPNPWSRYFGGYLRGWYYEETSSLYVNRGIGTSHLPLRFNCSPEVTILDV